MPDPLDDIRSNIPEVDTSIDPNQFASQPGVAVADTVQSDVELLDPPEDINAAQIGDYTPYTAVTGEVRPESTVEGRLGGLLSQNSDYMQRARTDAEAMANRRGLLNSSMAVGAAQGAAIDRALPIAQQDAQAFLEQDFLNQGYSNEAARYLAEQSVQKQNLQAGLEQDTRQFNQQNLLENQRLNQSATNVSSQEHARAQNLAAANAAAEANRNNFAVLDADLKGQLAGIDNQLAMNLEQLAREYDIIKNLDSINGSIYQQLVAEIGTIIANTDKPSEARAKVNALIQSAGVEFAFSSGETIGGGSSGGGPAPIPAPPAPVRPPKPVWGNNWEWNGTRWVREDHTCFTGDTIVTMFDGTEKEIADVQIGEALLGMDGEKNIVLEFDRPTVGGRDIYSFNDGKPFVTHEHPFMTSQGWKSLSPHATKNEGATVAVKLLLVGDYLEQLGDPLVKLTKIEKHRFDPETPLYNFKLAGNNTYYANGFLVHNKGGD